MEPFEGSNFNKKNNPSLLLIGESHYFPKNSLNHPKPEVWYAGIADKLTEKEQGWINTTEILKESKKQGFKDQSHSIWKKPFKIINNYGPHYSDFTQVADDIAFYNFFLRPAREGISLNVSSEDVDIANDVFLKNFKNLKPTGIVFLSKLAYKYLKVRDSIPSKIKICVTPHPGCSWWNRIAKSYGNRRGQDILRDYIKTLHWQLPA